MVSTQPENSQQQLLKILTRTWSRDSHGLFDYEANNTKNNLLLIHGKTKLVRKKNEVKHAQENSELELDERELGRVKIENGKYFLSNPIDFNMQATEQNITDLQNKIWYVIRQEDPNQGANPTNSNGYTNSQNDIYDIKINDIIKLGRVKYAITEVKLGNECKTIEKDVERPVFSLICDYKKTVEIHPDIICKICLSNHEEENNPMVNLCKCTGSISCVHFQCLKSWMHTKLNTKENEKKTVTLYSMKSFNCEICKTPYPLRFRSEDTYFDIIDYTRPVDRNYIILESLNQLKENNNYKSIQVITLNENEKIIMGRGHETDVRINDISVSRTHASLTLSNGKIYLKDLKSKFGTLALIQNDVELSEKPLSLQIGRTYAELNLISQKEYQKIKKDLSVKTDDKGLGNLGKTKQLFQVEKPGVISSSNTTVVRNGTRSNNTNGMDVDNIQNLNSAAFVLANLNPLAGTGILYNNALASGLNPNQNSNSNLNMNNLFSLNNFSLTLGNSLNLNNPNQLNEQIGQLNTVLNNNQYINRDTNEKKEKEN